MSDTTRILIYLLLGLSGIGIPLLILFMIAEVVFLDPAPAPNYECDHRWRGPDDDDDND